MCSRLFVTEYTQYRDSIEAAYIGLSRWMLHHPGEFQWFPLWYGGIPFQNTYPPLLHILVAGAAAVSGVSTALAYHAVTAAMYSLGPVTLFWFAWKFSGERWPSFAAALLYSVISPSALLIPAVAADMGSPFYARRLQALVRYGEGPHVAAMTLVPIALAALGWALRKRRPVPVYAAALTAAAVVVTNWLGALALAAAVLAYLLAEADRRWLGKLLLAAGIGVLAYAIASPWIPPSTIAAIRHNAQYTVGHYPLGPSQLLYLLLLAAALAALRFSLGRTRASPCLRFSCYLSLILGAIVLARYWFGVYLVPQPERYHLELEMALALAAVFAAARLPRRVRTVLLALFVLLVIVQARRYHSYARGLVQPADMQRGIEYETARWLGRNLPGARAFAAGSTRFWFTAFTDNPMLGGGFDQGITNPLLPHVLYGVTFAENDPARTASWLRAFGVKAIIVGGPGSRDAFRDFRDPGKFAGTFRELWRDGDDVIYEVPGVSGSLAHVIAPGQAVSRTPAGYQDTEPLAGYLAALADPQAPPAACKWLSPHEAEITASLEPGQLISVQVTYAPGWRARWNGASCPIRRDGLGLMLIDPNCDGPCTIRLTYDGGLEMRLARLASALAFLAGFLWLLAARKRWSRLDR